MTQNQFDAIVSLLKNLEVSKLVSIWNEYCDENNPDDSIYENEEYTLNEMFPSVDEALRAAYYGNYKYCDEYIMFNAYGNLVSFSDYMSEVLEHIDISSLATYVIENGSDLIDEGTVDLEDDFIEYANEKFNDKNFTVDDIPYGTDLVTEDWDDVIEDMIAENDEENEE